MFIGEYSHSVDTKGRLIVPSKFRETLGDSFVVTKGLDGCLFVFPEDEWEHFTQKLSELPLTKKDARQFSRFFLASAALCEVDKQGRILIPAALRAFASLDKEAVLVGISSRIEIWSRENWTSINEADVDNMDEIAEHMADLGIRF